MCPNAGVGGEDIFFLKNSPLDSEFARAELWVFCKFCSMYFSDSGTRC